MKFGKPRFGSLNVLLRRLDAFLSRKRLLPCLGAGQQVNFDEKVQPGADELIINVVPPTEEIQEEQMPPCSVEGDGQRPSSLMVASVASASVSTVDVSSTVSLQPNSGVIKKSKFSSSILKHIGCSAGTTTRGPRKRAVLVCIPTWLYP
jgi:hypothetical protein